MMSTFYALPLVYNERRVWILTLIVSRDQQHVGTSIRIERVIDSPHSIECLGQDSKSSISEP